MDIDENKLNSMLSEIISDLKEQDNKDKDIFNERYKDCFNAIIFNGHTWSNNQNLYSELSAFRLIDETVEVIVSLSFNYLNKQTGKEYSKCYLEYDSNYYLLEKYNIQGYYARITLIPEKKKLKPDKKIIQFNDVYNWVNNTNEWRCIRHANKKQNKEKDK